MIEIIKEGTLRMVTCPKCGCIFKYTEDELKDYVINVSRRRRKHYQVLTCPQCRYPNVPND